MTDLSDPQGFVKHQKVYPSIFGAGVILLLPLLCPPFLSLPCIDTPLPDRVRLILPSIHLKAGSGVLPGDFF